MRLVCPRCGAEYEIDDRLIPAAGREVACSSCENVWFQAGRQPVAPAAAEDTAPRLGRPLPEDVMGILRDEAAHFRASHPGIEGTFPADAPPADPDAGGNAGTREGVAADAGPATTAMTEEISGTSDGAATDDRPEAKAGSVSTPDDGKSADHDARPVLSGTIGPTTAAPPSPPATPRTVPGWMAPEPSAPVAVPTRRGAGFGKGFLIGLLIATVILGLYLAAPHAGEGWPGDMLRAIRAAGDGFHQWVQAQVARLR